MKILICDDHEVFRDGLAQIVGELAEDAQLLHAETGAGALAVADESPDLELALIDFQLPDTDGLELLAKLRERNPTTPVVMISSSEDAGLVRAALDGGASGFVPKSSKRAVLLGALRIVLEGEVYVPRQALAGAAPAPAALERKPKARKRRGDVLTPRQREVALLLARGLTNREIGNVLDVAEGTVKAHVAATLEALDVSNRTEAVMALRELGIDDESSEG